jgi:hypothetical protein
VESVVQWAIVSITITAFTGPRAMGVEYKIKFEVPADFNPSALFENLPSPIAPKRMEEIYNYAIEPDGFYFVDHLVNRDVASIALRRFIDEALAHAASVQITEL